MTSVHAARLQGLTGAENKDWNEILATADKVNFKFKNKPELLIPNKCT